jgi:hypothetical protein
VFVRSIKQSCLDRVILFGESLRKTVREFIAHYHTERNHQGVGNLLIVPRRLPPLSPDPFDARAVSAECLTTITEPPDNPTQFRDTTGTDLTGEMG